MLINNIDNNFAFFQNLTLKLATMRPISFLFFFKRRLVRVGFWAIIGIIIVATDAGGSDAGDGRNRDERLHDKLIKK